MRAIWIATNARTGSMWATNVVSEIVRRESQSVVDSILAARRDEARIALGQAHAVGSEAGVAVIKTHVPAPHVPNSVGIVTQRDVRDTAASYMRFMNASFDQTLRFARSCLIRTPEHLYPGDRRLLVSHDVIVQDPTEAVRRIADFLSAPTAAASAAEIAERFSKANVAKIVDRADHSVRERLRTGIAVERSELVVLSPRNWRAIDKDTQFQTGHVSERKPGDWRLVFNAEQQAALSALVGEYGRSVA